MIYCQPSSSIFNFSLALLEPAAMRATVAEVNFLLLVLFLLSVLFFFPRCIAIDYITQNQQLLDGDTIVSQNGSFELGFFSPNYSRTRYIGIWYKQSPIQKVVWVANREIPVADSSGIFSIDNHGNFIVIDGSGKNLWSSNSSTILRNTTAKLLDSGNLVLIEEASSDGHKTTLWQSFDHPSDSLIPTMNLGIDLKTGEAQFLTSWKSLTDPSGGLFSLGLSFGHFTAGFQRQAFPQVFLYNGSRPIWRSGQWNGQIFIGLPDMYSGSVDGIQLNKDNVEGRTFVTFYFQIKSRFFVDWAGMLKYEHWLERQNKWEVYWWQPHGRCDVYGMCGPFGICNPSTSPICSCLKGFVPKSMDEWSKEDWSGGCVRRTELKCVGSGNTSMGDVHEDGFLKLGGLKLPDTAGWMDVESARDCENACLNNCSCVAFGYVGGIGCMFWVADLMDIRQFSHGGEKLFIRLAKSELRKRRSVTRPIALAILGTAILAILAGVICILYKYRGKKRNSRAKDSSEVVPKVDVFRTEVEKVKGLDLPIFDLGTIAVAANNFSDSNKLGEGGFGPVYRGKLPGGQEIAVKRLSKSSGQGLEEFKNEVILISKLQHRNLVRLLGCCLEEDEKMLLYEYMPNKSLDAFLFDPSKRTLLDWGKRFHIIEGVARGLLYLHRDSRLRVIHRDLKASNILLDSEMNPKISDFGLARIFAGTQTPVKTNRVVGTYGYMAPEYAMEGRFSEKSDVFSFGVLLLEIVSGNRNSSFYNDEQCLNLISYAWQLWNEDKALQLIDPLIGNSCLTSEVLRCIRVGLLCVQVSDADRPSLSSVVLMLSEEAKLRAMPKDPAFSFASRKNPSPNSNEICSINDVTVTLPDGR